MDKPEEIEAKIRQLLDNDPTLSDSQKIVPRTEKVGPLFRKRIVVTIEGKVPSESEKYAVDQILNHQFMDSLNIKNQLEVDAS